MQAFPPLYEKKCSRRNKKNCQKNCDFFSKTLLPWRLCAKRPKIWQKKKDVNGIVIKNKHRNSCVRARQPCSPLQREVDAVIPKNIEHCASARRSLHAFRVLARARTRFLVNLLWLWYLPICKTGLKSPPIVLPTRESYTLLQLPSC